MEYGDLSDTGFDDPTYDALYNQEIHTVNPDARLNLLWKMQQILATARPYIPLVNANELQAVNSHWQGLQYTPRGFFSELSKANLENVHCGESPAERETDAAPRASTSCGGWAWPC